MERTGSRGVGRRPEWAWLEGELAATADPDGVAAVLSRLAERRPGLADELRTQPGLARALLRVLGASEALGRHLEAHPDDLAALRPPHAPASRARVVAELGSCADGDDLRRAYRRHLLRVAAFDLTAPDALAVVDAVGAHLADLADAVLAGALRLAEREVGGTIPRLAVVALGKTGARELNYVSDVDVLFVVEPAAGQGAEEAVAQGNLLAAAMARTCSAHTAAGTIWTLDAALRPDGKAGPLTRTLAGMRAYYGRNAKPWELQAMLKARPAAGDLELGRAFCAMVADQVWRVADQPGFVAECQAMRRRVVALLPPKDAAREIKLGTGGLRDVEFTAQLLQLIHGRADAALRVPGTLDALAALAAGGYIGRADGAELAAAYRGLRVLEHRLQLLRLRRTHLLPTDAPTLRRVSRLLAAQTEHDDAAALWRRTAPQVARLHQRLYYSPVLAAVARVRTDDLGLTESAARDRLASLGFLDPRSALTHIAALTGGLRRSAAILRALMPALLGWLAEAPNPDAGLLAFRRVTEALGDTHWYLGALRDEGAMAERLALVLGRSRLVVDLLLREPAAVGLLADEAELAPRPAAVVTAQMRAVAARQDTPERAVAAIRAVRRGELLRLALADVLGVLELSALGEGLSALTSATIDAALAACRHDGDPALGVVAMGRWGGAELGWASDADALFVVAEDGDVAAASALVGRVRDLLARPGTETALVLDADLRPEGRHGPLVRSLVGYAAYYQRWASPWEAQAMVRAAHGAGEAALTEALLREVAPLRAPVGGPDARALAEMRRLKARMETERARGRTSLKLSPGGLSDVEWTVQLLQLTHADAEPALRVTGTLPALVALRTAGLLEPDDAEALEQAWRFATRARNATMLVRGRPSDSLPTDPRDADGVALLLGYERSEWSRVLDDRMRLARRARAVTDRLFYGAAE